MLLNILSPKLIHYIKILINTISRLYIRYSTPYLMIWLYNKPFISQNFGYFPLTYSLCIVPLFFTKKNLCHMARLKEIIKVPNHHGYFQIGCGGMDSNHRFPTYEDGEMTTSLPRDIIEMFLDKKSNFDVPHIKNIISKLRSLANKKPHIRSYLIIFFIQRLLSQN